MGITIFDIILTLTILGDVRPSDLGESDSFRKAIEAAASEQAFYNPSTKAFDFYSWWDKHVHLVKEDIDVEKHRWQEYSGSVYKIGNRFLMVYGVSQEFSEMVDIGDGGESFSFTEVYPHTVTTTVFKSEPQDECTSTYF